MTGLPIDIATMEQEMPHGTGVDITSRVIADLESRSAMGMSRYGERLTSDNGRDALVDAYQEALDLALYLKQAIEERV